MHHTAALILKKEEWGEADWLITGLSPHFGKIRLRAQGARKHGAKLRGHLEPGSISEISFVIGRRGLGLTTARLRVSPPVGRAASWEQLQVAAAILRAIDANLLEAPEQASEIFSVTTAALASVAAASDTAAPRRILVWFSIRLLTFLGLLPASSSPEARSIPTLLRLAPLPLAGVLGDRSLLTALESELSELAARLGDAVRLPRAPAGFPSGVY